MFWLSCTESINKIEMSNKTLENNLEKLKAYVDELYNYRDYYFDNHPIESAVNFHSDVTEQLKKTVFNLQSVEEESLNRDRAYYFYVLGKAYNIDREYNDKAHALLSKATKLNPSIVDAWNHIGESYFKKGEYAEAKNCFMNALNKERNKESLRNLSVVLRKESGNNKDESVNNINLGLKYAREALELDPNDGTSWFFMGNAFMSSFFTLKQNAKTLEQAMDAYNRAEIDTAAKSNPDLHYNKGVALKFLEEYDSALQCFEKAHSFDPQWDSPKSLQERLLKYLSNIQDLIGQRGRVKNKNLQNLIRSINPKKHLGSFNKLCEKSKDNQSFTHVPLSHLKAGLNTDIVILGVVVCSIQNEELVPFTFCIVDEENMCLAVTIYNLANGQGVIIGDIVAIAMPTLKEINFSFKNKEFKFKSIRVSNPLLMALNGKPLPSNKISSMQMSTFSEADSKK